MARERPNLGIALGRVGSDGAARMDDTTEVGGEQP